jgi:hypothetical protein
VLTEELPGLPAIVAGLAEGLRQLQAAALTAARGVWHVVDGSPVASPER